MTVETMTHDAHWEYTLVKGTGVGNKEFQNYSVLGLTLLKSPYLPLPLLSRGGPFQNFPKNLPWLKPGASCLLTRAAVPPQKPQDTSAFPLPVWPVIWSASLACITNIQGWERPGQSPPPRE